MSKNQSCPFYLWLGGNDSVGEKKRDDTLCMLPTTLTPNHPPSRDCAYKGCHGA